MGNDEPDQIDRLLEGAVASYSNVEPLAGIEERVLQRVRVHGRRRRFGWFAAAGLAAAAPAALAVLVWTRPVPGPQRVILLPPSQAPMPVSAAPARPHIARRRTTPRVAPPTVEERALMALVEQAPDETRQAFLDLQRRSSEPIRVDEIKIEPLQSDGSR